MVMRAGDASRLDCGSPSQPADRYGNDPAGRPR